MGLNYSDQSLKYLLGNLATPVTLTNNYSDNVSPITDVGHFAEAAYFIKWVGTVGDTLFLKIEGSPDETYDTTNGLTQVFGQELFESLAAGVMTLTPGERKIVKASATENLYFFAPPAFKLLRVSAKETAAGAHGTLVLRVLLSGK